MKKVWLDTLQLYPALCNVSLLYWYINYIVTRYFHPRHKPKTIPTGPTPIWWSPRTHPATPTPSLPRRGQWGSLLHQAPLTEQPLMGTRAQGPCLQTKIFRRRVIVYGHYHHIATSTMSLISSTNNASTSKYQCWQVGQHKANMSVLLL